LDYAVEEDISQQSAEKLEMESCTPDKDTGTYVQENRSMMCMLNTKIW